MGDKMKEGEPRKSEILLSSDMVTVGDQNYAFRTCIFFFAWRIEDSRVLLLYYLLSLSIHVCKSYTATKPDNLTDF